MGWQVGCGGRFGLRPTEAVAEKPEPSPRLQGTSSANLAGTECSTRRPSQAEASVRDSGRPWSVPSVPTTSRFVAPGALGVPRQTTRGTSFACRRRSAATVIDRETAPRCVGRIQRRSAVRRISTPRWAARRSPPSGDRRACGSASPPPCWDQSTSRRQIGRAHV